MNEKNVVALEQAKKAIEANHIVLMDEKALRKTLRSMKGFHKTAKEAKKLASVVEEAKGLAEKHHETRAAYCARMRSLFDEYRRVSEEIESAGFSVVDSSFAKIAVPLIKAYEAHRDGYNKSLDALRAQIPEGLIPVGFPENDDRPLNG